MNSDNNNSNTPRLRFPGFTGEWEEKKLGDLANKQNKRNRNLEVSRVLTNSANAGVVEQSEYFDRDIAVKDNTANYHIVELEDFVYNPRISTAAPVGPISINKVGRGIMSPLYTIFRFHTGSIPFYEQYFQTTNWHPYLKSIANFGARFDRMNITSEGFFDMPLLLPTPAEQEKIASCLKAMDELIALQGQKVKALKERKRGLMQQLFPQPGETTPRLRFPGFTGDWQEKKLGDLCVFVNKKCDVNDLNISTYISTENMLQDFEGVKVASKLPSKGSFTHFQKNDILFSNIRPYLRKVWQSVFEGAASNDVIVFRSKESNNCFFLTQILKSDSFIAHTMNGAKGVKMPRGDKKTMMEYILAVPPTVTEQSKIAECLSEMESLIAAEAAKFEALKAYKRGLMQQLFPQPSK